MMILIEGNLLISNSTVPCSTDCSLGITLAIFEKHLGSLSISRLGVHIVNGLQSSSCLRNRAIGVSYVSYDIIYNCGCLLISERNEGASQTSVQTPLMCHVNLYTLAVLTMAKVKYVIES